MTHCRRKRLPHDTVEMVGISDGIGSGHPGAIDAAA